MGKPIWRRGARGWGSHPRTREALGARPRPLRGAAFNGWTGGDEGERKLSGCDLSPEVRVQGQKSPQVERRMASAFRTTRTAARRTLNTKRRSALHPLTFEGSLSCNRGAKERGPARGRPKNTGDVARLHDIQTRA